MAVTLTRRELLAAAGGALLVAALWLAVERPGSRHDPSAPAAGPALATMLHESRQATHYRQETEALFAAEDFNLGRLAALRAEIEEAARAGRLSGPELAELDRFMAAKVADWAAQVAARDRRRWLAR